MFCLSVVAGRSRISVQSHKNDIKMIFLILFVSVIALIYWYNTKNFDYWAKKGVKHDKPVIFFGNNYKNFLMMQSRSEAMEDMYNKYPNEKVIGFYRSSQPELIVKDPDLLKRVFKTDFQYFYRRGFHPYRHEIEPVMRNLFVGEGDLWKMLRHRMSSAFTITKLRNMFPLILDRTEKLIEWTMNSNLDEPIDSRDLMARYTTDFIGRFGFGLDPEALNQEDNEFRKLGNDIFALGFKDFVVATLKEFFPKLCKDLKFFGRVEKRFFDLVNHIQKSRDYKPSGRNDFIDQLLEYKQMGTIEFESIERTLPDGTGEKVTMEFTDTLFVAQVFVFFAAGFETSSNTTSYTFHLLAHHPEWQKKVQKEIDEVLAKHNNLLSYDSINDMTYLDWAFKESMRHFPALGHLSRECTRPYKVPGMNLTIDPDVRVMIPVKALHMDPKYWDNPQEFRPERFSPENFTPAQKSVYFPFGEGPRNCLGK